MLLLEFVHADFTNQKHQEDSMRLLNEYAASPIGKGRALNKRKLSNVWDNLAKREKWAQVFLGYSQNEAIALAIVFEGFSTFECLPLLNIHDFFIKQSYQKMGFGTLFLGHLLTYAKRSRFGKITLEVLCDNTPAKRLYGHFGFEPYENAVGGRAEFWHLRLESQSTPDEE